MRPSSALHVALTVALVSVTGCRGKLLATARLTGPGTAEAHFRPGKSVRLWSEFEGEWTGGKNSVLPIKYDVDVTQNGKSIAKIACDTNTSGTSVCGTKTTFGNSHTANCEVKLLCNLPTLGPGEATLKVTGRLGDPARVKHVSNMSINVRED